MFSEFLTSDALDFFARVHRIQTRLAASPADQQEYEMELGSQDKSRLIRLVLLCHTEQLIDKAQLLRSLELLHSSAAQATDLKEVLGDALPISCVRELQQRLARYQSLAAQVVETTTGEASSVSTSIVSHSSVDSDGVSNHMDVLEEIDSGDWDSDLHVSIVPKLLWPVAVICLGVLLYFVYAALPSIEEMFNTDKVGTSSSTREVDGAEQSSDVVGNIPQSFEPNGGSLAADGSMAEDENAADSPLGVAQLESASPISTGLSVAHSVENFAVNAQWDEALKLLNSDATLDSGDAQTSLLEAGVLLARNGRRDADDALMILVQPNVIQVDNPGWRQVFALALIKAGLRTRSQMVDALENSSARANVQPSVRLLVDWVKARNGSPVPELEELLQQSANFEATALDNIFLASANLTSGKPAQVSYHVSKARRRLNVENQQLGSELPLWLRDLCEVRLTDALVKLQEAAEASSDAEQ